MAKSEKAKKEECCEGKCDCETTSPSPFVAIPASLGGILLVIIALVLIFAEEQAGDVVVPTAYAFVILGFFALLFAYKSQRK